MTSLPDGWTREDVEFLLSKLELYEQEDTDIGRGQRTRVLVADTHLGIHTIHEIRDPTHLGFGYFKVETPEYELHFDGGGAMHRTPSGRGWFPLVIYGDWDGYDTEATKETLRGYL